MSICDPCNNFTCIRDIPECAQSLNIGEVTATTGEVTIYVMYEINGEQIIHRQDYDQDGYTADIILDLTNPTSDYYNRHNGLYKIWVTDKDDNITDRLTMTAANGTADTIWAVKFQDVPGNEIEDLIAEPLS